MGNRRLRKALGELRRGVGIARQAGPRRGVVFFQKEVLQNGLTRLRAKWRFGSAAQRVKCNLCGWRGPSFLTHVAGDYMDTNCFCPQCHSYPRHRGFAWLLQNDLGTQLAELEPADGLRLVFAPESGMLRLLGAQLSRLEGVDLHPINEHVVHLEDLQELSFGDESVDFISCFHVLEHVPKDLQALGEMRRVLRSGGRLILCVPTSFGRRETIDYGGPNPRMNEHCFDYGEDFVERLLGAGFSGTSYRLLDVVPKGLHTSLGMVQEEVFLLHRTPAGESPSIAAHPG